ncbi:hypothetical protein BN874_80008 [Candidatus Contendobacter odensis Run_B_J11]|uniref:Uncharacterized protein n=1 Tax=Candidatus Contendobacter odensis Run_B_J11 TaxID=1400861 RepID=A0A7U7J640_9GAMM|nr:hypothetical protein BN874_80008 [Candidatus Contendobacter odensis Run_B_J11]
MVKVYQIDHNRTIFGWQRFQYAKLVEIVLRALRNSKVTLAAHRIQYAFNFCISNRVVPLCKISPVDWVRHAGAHRGE